MHRQLLFEDCVVGVEILVGDGPNRSMAVGFSGLEVSIRQTQSDAPPGQTSSPDLMAPGPKERSTWVGGCGMLLSLMYSPGFCFQ